MRRAEMRALVLGAALALTGCDGCEKKEPPPQAAKPEPSSSQTLPQILKDGGPPSDPMLGNVGAIPIPIPMPPPAITGPIADASNAFAFDMYKRLAKLPDNVTFSPASISLALAMTWPGAKGETSAQMKKTMRFSTEPAATAEAWGKTTRALTARSMKLRIANRLFGEKTSTFEEPFLDAGKSVFGAPLETVDFKGSHEAVRERINHWVEEQTEKRIKDLLPPRSLTPDSRLVLANAVYFLADWETPFDKTKTTDAPFFVQGKTEKKVPTMHLGAKLSVAKADGITLVELPYAKREAVMFVAVPDKREGLPAVEAIIAAERFDTWRMKLREYTVALSIPRFEITTPSLSLGDHLAGLGMPLAFDRTGADFSGIAVPKTPDERFYLSAVMHKAFVHVDEKGTEAAAATGAVVAATASVETPPPPLTVNVDHPFLFFIVEKDSGLVLFMGRVVDPS